MAHLLQVLTVKAAMAFLLLHDSDTSLHKALQDLLQPMLNIVALTIEQGDDDVLLKSLVDVAENCPKYLRSQVEPILELSVKVNIILMTVFMQKFVMCEREGSEFLMY